jgi:hypothetical protein
MAQNLYNQSATFAITTGIDDEAAEKILLKFYRGDDAQGTTGEASPLKVRRTNQRLIRSHCINRLNSHRVFSVSVV